jgi:hypothetical protein
MRPRYGIALGLPWQADARHDECLIGGLPAVRLSARRCGRIRSWISPLTTADVTAAVAGRGGEAHG